MLPSLIIMMVYDLVLITEQFLNICIKFSCTIITIKEMKAPNMIFIIICKCFYRDSIFFKLKQKGFFPFVSIQQMRSLWLYEYLKLFISILFI